MTPAARLQAAAEVLDEVLAATRADGAAADSIVTRYFKSRRYAGSKDRKAVRELVFRAIRRSAEPPADGRSAVLGLAAEDPELLSLLGQPRGPAPLGPTDQPAPAGIIPRWIVDELSPLVSAQEWPALLERAPLDLRVNVARTAREEMLGQFAEAVPTRLSPWGLRLLTGSRVDDHPAILQGLVEIQDEGSQLIALACSPSDGQQILDLCAGAGGKALALAAAAPGATILATDANRQRLAQLEPRALRAGASIEARLLDPPGELDQLEDWRGQADTVLVDAPCSGSGTWRRNPEGRWRLTQGRLDRLTALQERLLDLASALVRPGGTLVYAVCSILAREGAGQAQAFLQRHSSWVPQEIDSVAGRSDGVGRLLTPGLDQTDGFFIARLQRPC